MYTLLAGGRGVAGQTLPSKQENLKAEVLSSSTTFILPWENDKHWESTMCAFAGGEIWTGFGCDCMAQAFQLG